MQAAPGVHNLAARCLAPPLTCCAFHCSRFWNGCLPMNTAFLGVLLPALRLSHRACRACVAVGATAPACLRRQGGCTLTAAHLCRLPGTHAGHRSAGRRPASLPVQVCHGCLLPCRLIYNTTATTALPLTSRGRPSHTAACLGPLASAWLRVRFVGTPLLVRFTGGLTREQTLGACCSPASLHPAHPACLPACLPPCHLPPAWEEVSTPATLDSASSACDSGSDTGQTRFSYATTAKTHCPATCHCVPAA